MTIKDFFSDKNITIKDLEPMVFESSKSAHQKKFIDTEHENIVIPGMVDNNEISETYKENVKRWKTTNPALYNKIMNWD